MFRKNVNYTEIDKVCGDRYPATSIVTFPGKHSSNCRE